MSKRTKKSAPAIKSVVRTGAKTVIGIAWNDDRETEKARLSSFQKRYRFASGRDPFSAPYTKTDCSHVCENDFPPFKYCCEYTTYYQWVYVDWYLVINLAELKDIEREVRACLEEAAIVSLISAIIAAFVSGGGAALEAAKDAFVAAVLECLERKLSELKVLGAWVDTSSHRGDWETN